MEVGFERILADIEGTPTLLTVGKDGILWKIDRTPGEYIDLLDTMETEYLRRDRNTGRSLTGKILLRWNWRHLYSLPGIYGGHNWQSATYDAERHLLFLPVHQLVLRHDPREVDLGPGGGGYGADVATYPCRAKRGSQALTGD